MGGIFGGGGDAADELEDMLSEQTNQTRAETQRKIDSLKQQRLSIIHSQGGQQWTSSAPPPPTPSPPVPIGLLPSNNTTAGV